MLIITNICKISVNFIVAAHMNILLILGIKDSFDLVQTNVMCAQIMQ